MPGSRSPPRHWAEPPETQICPGHSLLCGPRLPQARVQGPVTACLSHCHPPPPPLSPAALPRCNPTARPQSSAPHTWTSVPLSTVVPRPAHLPFLVPRSAPTDLLTSRLRFHGKTLLVARSTLAALRRSFGKSLTHVCASMSGPLQPPVPKHMPGSPTPVASTGPVLLIPRGCGHPRLA